MISATSEPLSRPIAASLRGSISSWRAQHPAETVRKPLQSFVSGQTLVRRGGLKPCGKHLTKLMGRRQFASGFGRARLVWNNKAKL